MPAPLKSRCFWPSTAASIPAGWTRDTDFDDLYLQGFDATYTGPANAGGSHAHTADSHTHTGDGHTHLVGTNSELDVGTSVLVVAGTTIMLAQQLHGHNQVASNSTTLTYGSTTVTIDVESAHPPFHRLIVIKPDDASKNIPNGAIVLGGDTTDPSGFNRTDGTSGTPNLVNLFIRGAAAGTDAGGTGGSSTHTHTSPSHTHTVGDHAHASKLCGSATTEFNGRTTGFVFSQTRISAHHNVSLDSQSLSDLSSTAIAVNAASSEPEYIQILGLMNSSGSSSTPLGIILPFIGTVAEIPAGWAICDGSGGTIDMRNRQIKVTASNGSIGTTGGANSHNHTTAAHGHTHGAHGHTVTQDSSSNASAATGASSAVDQTAHTHTDWATFDATPTLQNQTATLQTSDLRAAYRTVIWIKNVSDAGVARVVTVGGVASKTKVVVTGRPHSHELQNRSMVLLPGRQNLHCRRRAPATVSMPSHHARKRRMEARTDRLRTEPETYDRPLPHA